MVIESLESKKKVLELDAVWNGEQVKVFCNVLKMKEGSPGDLVNVMVKLHLAVKNYSKVQMCVEGDRMWLLKVRLKFCTAVRGVGFMMMMLDFSLFSLR